MRWMSKYAVFCLIKGFINPLWPYLILSVIKRIPLKSEWLFINCYKWNPNIWIYRMKESLERKINAYRQAKSTKQSFETFLE